MTRRGGRRGITGEEKEGSSGNVYKGHMNKDNRWGEDRMWEVGVGRAGESKGRKMGTAVIEQ